MRVMKFVCPICEGGVEIQLIDTEEDLVVAGWCTRLHAKPVVMYEEVLEDQSNSSSP